MNPCNFDIHSFLWYRYVILLRADVIHGSMSREEHSSKFSRRSMLRAAVGVPLASQTAIGNVAAAEEKRYILTQGSTEIEITPLSYEDYTVEEFYNYYSGDSHTPTDLEKGDTSRMYLYEGPAGELSLVFMHDKPYADDSGGDAVYEFGGLPSDGSWVIQDDPENESADSYSRTRTEWNWKSNHTDGGAFRGGLAETGFTISPQKQGTSNFEVLSGSASIPTVTTLDLYDEVGVAPEEAGSNWVPIWWIYGIATIFLGAFIVVIYLVRRSRNTNVDWSQIRGDLPLMPEVSM